MAESRTPTPLQLITQYGVPWHHPRHEHKFFDNDERYPKPFNMHPVMFAKVIDGRDPGDEQP